MWQHQRLQLKPLEWPTWMSPIVIDWSRSRRSKDSDTNTSVASVPVQESWQREELSEYWEAASA